MSIFILIFILIITFNIFVYNQQIDDDFFPYLVQFYTIVPCGGVLITPDWVLTAAQCLVYKRNSILVNIVWYNETVNKPIGVKATFIHPSFDMYSKVHDHRHNVALMKLYRPFNLQHLHNSLDFSNKTSGMFVNIGATKSINSYDCCFIYGWDSILFSKMRVFTKPIQIVSVQPRDKDACVNKINDVNIVCASGESRKQCAGNPGSPIVCNEPDGNSRVLGIASWTNYSLQCDGSSTYLNLTSFRSWINNLISMDFNLNYNSDNYSSTENYKIQSKNHVITKIIMVNQDIGDFSTTLKTLDRHNYENTERSDKNVEEKPADNEELSDIFPLYNTSCANLLNSINFLVLLGLTLIFNV